MVTPCNIFIPEDFKFTGESYVAFVFLGFVTQGKSSLISYPMPMVSPKFMYMQATVNVLFIAQQVVFIHLCIYMLTITKKRGSGI